MSLAAESYETPRCGVRGNCTILTDIIARLRQGRFPNEQAISQGIVLRVLQELGWDIYDTTAVWPEFQTGEGRADFALCHPPSKPADFMTGRTACGGYSIGWEITTLFASFSSGTASKRSSTPMRNCPDTFSPSSSLT